MSDYQYQLVVTPGAKEKCFWVRHDVFVLEQGIDEETEIEGNDDCAHFLGTCFNDMHGVVTYDPVAAARILPKGETAKIQRLAVIAHHREHGVGAGLMQFMIEHARSAGYQHLELGSQVKAIGFYEKLGFMPFGDQYEDVGIPHQDMRLTF